MKFLILIVFTLYPSIVLGDFGPYKTTEEEKKIKEEEKKNNNMEKIDEEIKEANKENIDPKKK